ncbi:hypothetical protein BQ8482_180003 [Mesorhizobium delmotii]|uniref:Uncharacterized protein n=1 Tax=Mesorhizobium delmotii TaxID=1631247 RepID=A0A2P9AI29_9HYPH|nr:hypothetical protein BQ8482_180003 [Mesorhizobium delmotii]
MSGWCPSSSANRPTSSTKVSASRKSANLNLRRIRCPASRRSQPGVWERYPPASFSVSGGMPPRQGVQVLWAMLSAMTISLIAHRGSRCSDHCLPHPIFARIVLAEKLANLLGKALVVGLPRPIAVLLWTQSIGASALFRVIVHLKTPAATGPPSVQETISTGGRRS